MRTGRRDAFSVVSATPGWLARMKLVQRPRRSAANGAPDVLAPAARSAAARAVTHRNALAAAPSARSAGAAAGLHGEIAHTANGEFAGAGAQRILDGVCHMRRPAGEARRRSVRLTGKCCAASAPAPQQRRPRAARSAPALQPSIRIVGLTPATHSCWICTAGGTRSVCVRIWPASRCTDMCTALHSPHEATERISTP